MSIEIGQIYRCAVPGEDHRRIKVLEVCGQLVDVVDADDLKRPRQINRKQFHADRYTEKGTPRRTGYVLEPERLWTAEELEDATARWHDSPDGGTPLHAYLGMTTREYTRWVEDPTALPPRRLP